AVGSTGTHDFHVSSHGVEVDHFTVSAAAVTLHGMSQTMTAYAGDTAVFTLTVNGDGSWVFALLEPLDDSRQGEDHTRVSLAGLIKAVDFDGDSVTLTHDFSVRVKDDVPQLAFGEKVIGHVDEGALVSTRNDGTDSYGDGNDPGGSVTTDNHIAGSLRDLVDFG